MNHGVDDRHRLKFILSLFTCAWLVGAVLFAGCRTDAVAVKSTDAEERSVRPGVNAEYLKPGLVVTQWVERLEREGREIFDHRQKIVAAAKIRRGAVIADIGAGTGLFTPMLAEAVGSKGQVIAVDIVKQFLDLIEKRSAAAGIKNVRTVLCTERSVELPPNSIDLAFICDVYHHVEYPHSSLASLHRALRRNGEIMMIEFRRIPGQSSDWILNHVRAGQEVFTAEVEAAGFKKVEEIDLLKDNYMLRFRKRGYSTQ
ncbi:MAG: class I SAM-dependent methyltransferase [Verrucomicrobia bacterium]|nr:class I SAM-dependent methyltransferase [Verrucomicrobiota bacterium]